MATQPGSGRGRAVFTGMKGVAIGMLVTGLVLPFVSGERAGGPGETVTAGGATAGGESIGGAGEVTTADPSAAGSTGGSAQSSTAPAASGAPGGEATTASSPEPAAPGAPGGGGGPALAATDRGVTASTIRIGFALLDLGGASAVGLGVAGYSIEEQKRSYQVFVDDINRRGGINGRKIQAFYRASDPLNRDSSQALCLGFSRDDKVFAVLAQPGFRAHLCVAQQEQMLLMIDFAASDIMARSGGRIVTNQQAGNRMMFDWIGELDRMGVLKGKKLGVLGDEDTANGDKQAVEQGVLPALKQLGYDVAYRSRLSENLNTGAGQIPVEVSQMRRAGVDAVLIATNFVYSTQFVQTADSQGWRPGWFTSDHNGMAGDDLTENMPSSFDGAISVTVSRSPVREAREGLPEAAPERTCREFFNRTTGEATPYGETSPVPYSCGQVRLFAAAAGGAGPNLTRQSFMAALQRQRQFVMPGLFGGGFGPGKVDYADVVRPLRWSRACKCWRYSGPPSRVRF